MSDTYPILREFLLNEYFLKDDKPTLKTCSLDVRKIPNADSISYADGMPGRAEPSFWYAQWRRHLKSLESGMVPATFTIPSPGIVAITSSKGSSISESPFPPLLSTLADITNTTEGFEVLWEPHYNILEFWLKNQGIALFLNKVKEDCIR